MSETVLVTGGTGWIASWTIIELLRRGYTVRTTARSLASEPKIRARIAPHVDAGGRLAVVAADLGRGEGWGEAADGVAGIIHMATPLGTQGAQDLATMTEIARAGTLRVLKAAVDAGVPRVVMTSSGETATLNKDNEHAASSLNDESKWTDVDRPGIDPYPVSKTLAEQAAWAFIREQGGATALTTILPSAVLGPVLFAENLGTPQLVQAMLTGHMPATPNIGFHVADVRDVAALHVTALETPAAAGERFLAAGEWTWMAGIAATLRDRLGEKAKKVPTRGMPDWLMRLVGRFDRRMRFFVPSLGRRHEIDSAKARRALGWNPRPLADTLVDCAESLEKVGALA